jgi:sugar phosphate isomerase/epimerase
MRDIVDFAAECGTHVTIGSIRGFAKWAPTRTDGEGWFADALAVLTEHAASVGVEVVLEPQNRQVTDLANTVAGAIRLIQDLGLPALAVEADSYHMALEERSVPAALVTAQRSGLLRHVQLSDSNRLAPGWGFLNWADIFATLDALDYDRWICIEALQSPNSEAVAMQGHRLATAMGRHDDN